MKEVYKWRGTVKRIPSSPPNSSPYPRDPPEGPEPISTERVERILADELKCWRISDRDIQLARYFDRAYAEFDARSAASGDVYGFKRDR